MVKDWEAAQLKKSLLGSVPNPYEDPIIETTVQDVKLELAKEDAADGAKGVISAHSTTVTEFLVKGLELEEQQYSDGQNCCNVYNTFKDTVIACDKLTVSLRN
ncbi:hypothetical protein Agabi119p4_10523 [Agaricus bisporus var. burnettii]|uniref:Uncharacterized protein n=1 Tax=Agaricus bisporus var. burnettii TaxID=192524 RepID=A0A8H7C1Q4_AGABI|nr:hypothetical protein Agabi119p4_10523 [Agaricus bisporus var. burnettii]